MEEFVRTFQKEINLQRRDDEALHEAKRRDLAAIKRQLDGLIDAIADGLRAPGLQQRLDELEARRIESKQSHSPYPSCPAPRHRQKTVVFGGVFMSMPSTSTLRETTAHGPK